jgi:hypothetical protein
VASQGDAPPPAIDVRHNESASRFEAIVEGRLCRADYVRIGGPDGDVLRIHHTEVPVELEGRGIAAAVVRYALDHAARHGLKVAPACSYVRAYMRRHPETHALLAPGVTL